MNGILRPKAYIFLCIRNYIWSCLRRIFKRGILRFLLVMWTIFMRPSTVKHYWEPLILLEMNSIRVWTSIFLALIIFWYISIERTRNLQSHTLSPTEILEEPINHEEFKPLIIYYNRVGKCGSRSLLSVTNGISKKNGFEFVSETPLYQEKGT